MVIVEPVSIRHPADAGVYFKATVIDRVPGKQEDVVPKVLTDEQIEFFNREGYLYPVEGIPKERCNELLGALDDFEAKQGVNAGLFKLKGHLCFAEAWDLVREPRILVFCL